MSKKEEFTIDSRDGKTKLHAVKWIPDGEPVCVLQIIHGMNEYILRYEEFAAYMAERGILVVGDDHLGHGQSVPEGGQYGYFCENDAATVLVRDEHRLKKTIQQEYPMLPYLIFGHSMGSFILRNYLLRYGTGIQGAIICGTGTPERWHLLGGKCLTTILKWIHGDHYVSKLVDDLSSKAYKGGKNNQETNVFSVNAYRGLFDLAFRMQNEKDMANIPKKLPVLIVSGSEDAVGSFGKAPQKLYDDMINLDMTKVTCKLYNGYRHELLSEPIKETVFIDLFNWISMVVTEAAGREM